MIFSLESSTCTSNQRNHLLFQPNRLNTAHPLLYPTSTFFERCVTWMEQSESRPPSPAAWRTQSELSPCAVDAPVVGPAGTDNPPDTNMCALLSNPMSCWPTPGLSCASMGEASQSNHFFSFRFFPHCVLSSTFQCSCHLSLSTLAIPACTFFHLYTPAYLCLYKQASFSRP